MKQLFALLSDVVSIKPGRTLTVYVGGCVVPPIPAVGYPARVHVQGIGANPEWILKAYSKQAVLAAGTAAQLQASGQTKYTVRREARRRLQRDKRRPPKLTDEQLYKLLES